MSAIFFGSISTLSDTSELQRDAFNRAFAQHRLSWTWSREDYLSMLETSGGSDRVAAYAEERGERVDSAAVHRTKSALFQQRLGEGDVAPRPGVAQTIADAKAAGFSVALVTTTATENVLALLEALRPDVSLTDFDLVVDLSSVQRSKPDPEAYLLALTTLNQEPGSCVAIEDNLGGVAAAKSAGLTCFAFPNENTAGHDFSAADGLLESVDFDQLRRVVAGA